MHDDSLSSSSDDEPVLTPAQKARQTRAKNRAQEEAENRALAKSTG